MASPRTRIGVLQVLLLGGLLAIVGRAAQLQLVEGERWAQAAERSRTMVKILPARRGTLYDRRGTPLAISQESYRVEVTPREIRGSLTDSVARWLVRDLGLSARKVRSAFAVANRKDTLTSLNRYRPVTASQVEGLRGVRGVRLYPVYTRARPYGSLAIDLLGSLVSDSGRGRSGMERSLDSLLAGVSGEAGFLRTPGGTLYESPDRRIREPVPGHDVYLTLDAELQSIAESALAETLEAQNAEAGDVVFIEPRTGEVLALTSQVRLPSGAARAGAWVPAEPGSTIKPFAAAGLLRLGRVSPTDSVYGEEGSWVVPKRARPVTDVHPVKGYMTLAMALRESSNIGMGKFTSRLSYQEHYDILRDFGFGTATGIEVPGEYRGSLRLPHLWEEGNTQPSLAQGYEIQITPLQMAAAYAALANDGWLPELTLIREVRDPAGATLYRHRPTPVRRVIDGEIARQVRHFLAGAAGDSGTGRRAQLDTYRVLGKTGTAKNVVEGRYAANHYTASFAGIFPAEDPQLVVVIRIIRPLAGQFYGGEIAAPMNRQMLQDALAVHRDVLDRSRLQFRSALAPHVARVDQQIPATRTVISLRGGATSSARPAVTVPDVVGLEVREAVYRLHQRGLRASLSGVGPVVATSPAAGATVTAGTTVALTSGAER
ncbi:MAG: penicillin-binding transpeptidase domain-containing protein [Gemmatimonadota bacterium]